MTAKTADEPRRTELIAFLKTKTERQVLTDGTDCTREQAQGILQALIEPEIQVRDVCSNERGIVVAAPHVSFDHWSEYFCNRTASHLKLGRVVAKHYRDQDNLHIPVSIGRHIHVNRPSESDGPGEPERLTDRARAVYENYVVALQTAGGGVWPLKLLIEFHSQKQTPHIEIATRGVEHELAAELLDWWNNLRQSEIDLPEFRIEPLHKLKFTAASAKHSGSLQSSVCNRALHIEIPRGARRSEEFRQLANGQILSLLGRLIERLGV